MILHEQDKQTLLPQTIVREMLDTENMEDVMYIRKKKVIIRM